MITKEQARLALKVVNPVKNEDDEVILQLAETVIALHERVERLEELLGRAVNGPWLHGDLERARAILKEITHD